MKKELVIAVAAAGISLVSLGAAAYEQGDIVFRAGIATVAPSGDSDAIELPTDPPTIVVDSDPLIPIRCIRFVVPIRSYENENKHRREEIH